MNTESLEYFIKVYEKKSVTAAAKDLYITPQGVSKTIKQLELELETELFYRGPRGVEATEAGELLHARAKHLRYLIEDIKKEISIISGSKGTLNILVTYSTTLMIPVDYLFRFSDIYPDIQVKLKEYPDEYPLDNLFQEDIDAGLVMDPDKIDNCESELVAHGEVVIVVAKTHPLAKNDEISVLDLESESVVLKAVGEGREHRFVEACLEKGFTPNIIHEYGSIISAHRLCEMNGYAAVSIDFVEEAIGNENLKIVRLKDKIPQNIYLILRKRNIQSKAVSQFHNYIMEKSKSF
ncbi:DNA-binding transcriptional regulator, LysR family [Gracilibacillus ureilyticus]|uniref:DNA-binding transcriptional regulator, LysR family n=1 Tax=Gracilibacillus ureilyticus TaxID=531814 RepID=A0A1H9Q4N9_9BACI|nr:LysR family transcriptional regulator [Gracilibacillus ureilyticus]SER55362.1 DNA-binding transcriptional regulator, LysR family [Gracilibacillus ureilyticus]